MKRKRVWNDDGSGYDTPEEEPKLCKRRRVSDRGAMTIEGFFQMNRKRWREFELKESGRVKMRKFNPDCNPEIVRQIGIQIEVCRRERKERYFRWMLGNVDESAMVTTHYDNSQLRYIMRSGGGG